jgi:putative membrane protein
MFSEHDLTKIRDAVRAAERRTRGEIVPMVVPASARYRESWHLTGLVVALLALSAFLAFEYGWGPHDWPRTHPGWIVLGVLVAYLVGHAVGTLHGCVRLFTSQERMATKVRRRAESAFHEQGLHKTREGTGVLIFLSLLERRAQVLADRAIHERVPPGTWDELVKDLVRGIHDGQPTDALCRAIARCGDLLAPHFPAKEGDNPNELPDDMVRGR